MPDPTLEEILAGAEARMADDDKEAVLRELGISPAPSAADSDAPARAPGDTASGPRGDATPPTDPGAVGWFDNATAKLAKGASLGTAPYLEAAYRVLTQGGDYDQHLGDIQDAHARGSEQHPYSSGILEMGGAMATGGAVASGLRASAPAVMTMAGAAEGGVPAALEPGADAIDTAAATALGAVGGRGTSSLLRAAARRRALQRAARAETAIAAREGRQRLEGTMLGKMHRAAPLRAPSSAAAPAAPGPSKLHQAGKEWLRKAMDPKTGGAAAATEYIGTNLGQPGVGAGLKAATMVKPTLKVAKEAGRAALEKVPQAVAQAGVSIARRGRTAPLATAPLSKDVVESAGETLEGAANATGAADIVRRMARQRRRARTVDVVRAGYVGGAMSPRLRNILGPAIEGGSAQDIAVAMEDAQQDPRLARELRALQEGKADE